MHDTRDLTTRLAELLHREHAALADFLIALAEFDSDRRWLELGYSSLFYFLHRELRLSKGAAFYRKTAAELIQRYPEVVKPLRDGRLCLTSIVELVRGLVKKPRASPARLSASPRHIPAEVKRVVWTRDGGRCQWPVASGGVCGSTTRLELDHIVPVARGGASTTANLRVTCRIHNQLAARQAFGDAWMDRFTSGPAQGSASPLAEARCDES
jgi:5-methylcytosine-specific restriction endonuclease McrA